MKAALRILVQIVAVIVVILPPVIPVNWVPVVREPVSPRSGIASLYDILGWSGKMGVRYSVPWYGLLVILLLFAAGFYAARKVNQRLAGRASS